MFLRSRHADRLDALEQRVEHVEDTLTLVTRSVGAIEGSLTRIASTLDRMAKHFPDPDDDE